MLENEIYLDFDSFEPDAILDLDLDINSRLFPENRHTFGDLSKIGYKKYLNENDKIYKDIHLYDQKVKKHEELENADKVFKLITAKQENILFKNSNTNNVFNKTENKEANIINEYVDNKIEQKINQEFSKLDTHISNLESFVSFKEETINEIKREDVIINNLQKSNNLTIEQVNQLEQNISNLSSTNKKYYDQTVINNLEKNIIQINENSKNLKEDIDKVDKKFEDFISS